MNVIIISNKGSIFDRFQSFVTLTYSGMNKLKRNIIVFSTVPILYCASAPVVDNFVIVSARNIFCLISS
jgi:hypothetical protein